MSATVPTSKTVSDDLKRALERRALVRQLGADQSPLELLARQMDVTVEQLAAELLKELVAFMRAIEPLPNSPPTSTKLH